MSGFKHVPMYAVILLGVLLLGASCADRHAGSVSETTNGSLAGLVIDSAGTPAEGADVFLVLVHVNPTITGSIKLAMTADSSGAFAFKSVPPGVYNVLVRDSVQGKGAYIDSLVVTPGDHSTLSNSISLQALSEVRVHWEHITPSVGDRVYIPGTDIYVQVTESALTQGWSTLAHVPMGEYDRLNWARGNDSIGFAMISDPYRVTIEGVDLFPDPDSRFNAPMGYATVQGNVTGGLGGDTVIVNQYDSMRLALRDSLPRVVLINGTIVGTDMMKVGSNKTVLGINRLSRIEGFGLSLFNCKNVIVRNLSFASGSTDAISIEDSSEFIWIDHNDFSDYADGIVDIKRGSNHVTISWNLFHDQQWVSLVGHSDSNGDQDRGKLRTTYHHNWFAGTTAYNPRVRYGHVHLFNNFFEGISEYAVGAGVESQVLIEANAFVSVPQVAKLISSGAEIELRLNWLDDSTKPQNSGAVAEPPYVYRLDYAVEVPALVRWGAGVGKLSF